MDGLCVVLWSVPRFAMQGHHFSFEYNSVRLTFNVNEPSSNQLILNIAHPYYRQVQGPRSQLSQDVANMVETRSQKRQLRQPSRRALQSAPQPAQRSQRQTRSQSQAASQQLARESQATLWSTFDTSLDSDDSSDAPSTTSTLPALIDQPQPDSDDNSTQQPIPLRLVRPPTNSKRKIPLELLHVRLGHRSFKSLLAGSNAGVWADCTAIPSNDTFCLPCKIASIRSKNRSNSPVAYATQPGQALFIDIVNNPSKRGLTPSSYYSDYLIVTDYYSRYSTFIGLKGTKTQHIIAALE